MDQALHQTPGSAQSRAVEAVVPSFKRKDCKWGRVEKPQTMKQKFKSGGNELGDVAEEETAMETPGVREMGGRFGVGCQEVGGRGNNTEGPVPTIICYYDSYHSLST